MEMEGGTEAFPDLGRHCQLSDCNQLDFLPFKCDGCCKVFCVEHRSKISHECPKSDHNSRKVAVCEICSTSIEIKGEETEKATLEIHEKSGVCDPKKKKKPTCSVRRCKEMLTFSNTSTCKTCGLKVCLKHRFSVDHACKQMLIANMVDNGRSNNKFMVALAARNGKDCGKNNRPTSSPPSTPQSVKAF